MAKTKKKVGIKALPKFGFRYGDEKEKGLYDTAEAAREAFLSESDVKDVGTIYTVFEVVQHIRTAERVKP